MATEYRPAPNAEVGGKNIVPKGHRNIHHETEILYTGSKLTEYRPTSSVYIINTQVQYKCTEQLLFQGKIRQTDLPQER